eukprot:jgi/Orpsp1_1/1191062/evm.model.d7180000083239.1
MNLDDKTKRNIDFKNNTAYEIWNLLKKSFMKNNEEMKLDLNKKLKEMKYNINDDFGMFLSNMENTLNKLEELGENVSDERKFNYLFNSLPNEIIIQTNIMEYQDEWEKCCKMLNNKVPRLKYLKELKDNQEKIKALNVELNKQYNYKRKIICRKCGKRGHIARDCWSRRKRNNYKNNNYRERKSENKNVINNKGNKGKYQANNANIDEEKQERAEVEKFNEIFENVLNTDYNEDDVNQSNNATSSSNKNFHSGASYHMIHQKENLINTSDYHINIHFANGDIVKSELIGQYIGLINNHKIILNDVLYVPSFKRSLLSIDHLSEDNFKTVFYKNKHNNKKCAILYNNHVPSFNNTLCYNIEDATNDSNLNLWHRRFGHFNIDLIKNKLIKLKINIPKCKICLKSKLKNFPFYPATNHTNNPFELIHMDLVQAPDYSIYGNKYFLTILDDYSRYSWVLFIKNKSDVFNKFIIWYNKIKNQYNNYNIKHIKTDNGTEFFNNNFNEFYNKTGIIHEHTVAYNPQQNGRVERLHGTLISNGDAMLADAKLSHKFWEDAVSTANYIHNRLPHRGNNNKIPYEVLNNKKVDYNKLKVFGCKVYFYVPVKISLYL